MASIRLDAPRQGNLVYCVFGSELYFLEARFSLLSALKYRRPGAADFGVIVCTTRPELFEGYPVIVEPITIADLDDWKGPHGYFYRFQIQVLRYVMDRHPSAAILLDSDTYFTDSPQKVFDQVGPGRSIMHRDEGLVFRDPNHAEYARRLEEFFPDLVVPLDGGGSIRLATESTTMWNAGTVGIDLADRSLLDEALAICDTISRHALIFTTAQFSLGAVLAQKTQLVAASPTIAHYWADWVDPYLNTSWRRLMHTQIRDFFRAAEGQGFEATLEQMRQLRIQSFRRPLPVKILAKLFSPKVVTRIFPPVQNA